MPDGDRFGRILLVDDEEEVQTLVGWVLRDLGYDVDLAGSGPEALGCLASARPDLVLLDLILPGAPGWLVLGQLAEAPEHSVPSAAHCVLAATNPSAHVCEVPLQ